MTAPVKGNDMIEVWKCPICEGETAKETYALMVRVGKDTSFQNLWRRLDQAERDRDRMLNALQIALGACQRDSGKLKPREISILRRAMIKVSACHADTQAREAGL